MKYISICIWGPDYCETDLKWTCHLTTKCRSMIIILRFLCSLALKQKMPWQKYLRNLSIFDFFILVSQIPQGQLHIAQVPQGEEVQITQDSEASVCVVRENREHQPLLFLSQSQVNALVWTEYNGYRKLMLEKEVVY